MMNTQSNTNRGPISIVANADLSAKEGYLIILVDGGTDVYADLPSAVTDIAIAVLDSVDVAGERCNAIPLTPDQEVRIKAKGTGSAGAILVLADTGTAADKGKVRTLPGTAGLYFSPGIAKTDFVDGQLLLVQPLPRLVSVKPTPTQDALTDNSTGVASTTLAALSDLATAGGNTYTDAAVNAKLAVIRNALASLAAQLAKVKTDVAASIADLV